MSKTAFLSKAMRGKNLAEIADNLTAYFFSARIRDFDVKTRKDEYMLDVSKSIKLRKKDYVTKIYFTSSLVNKVISLLHGETKINTLNKRLSSGFIKDYRDFIGKKKFYSLGFALYTIALMEVNLREVILTVDYKDLEEFSFETFTGIDEYISYIKDKMSYDFDIDFKKIKETLRDVMSESLK